jgi:hypothetical protein
MTLPAGAAHSPKGPSKKTLQSWVILAWKHMPFYCVRHHDYCCYFMIFPPGVAHFPKTTKLDNIFRNTLYLTLCTLQSKPQAHLSILHIFYRRSCSFVSGMFHLAQISGSEVRKKITWTNYSKHSW